MESKHGRRCGSPSRRSRKVSKDECDDDDEIRFMSSCKITDDRHGSYPGSRSITRPPSPSRAALLKMNIPTERHSGGSTRISTPTLLSPRTGYNAEAKEHSARRQKGESLCSSREEKVESEFDEMLHSPDSNSGGEIVIPIDPAAVNILNGFKIISMSMRDGETGKLVWESSSFGPETFLSEQEEYIPQSILECHTVSREINFASVVQLNKFRIEQKVFFGGHCVEEWFFSFGFVIPGSTNSWQQLIEAAPKDEMMKAEDLSGRITFETSFFDDKMLICRNLVRIFYV